MWTPLTTFSGSAHDSSSGLFHFIQIHQGANAKLILKEEFFA